MRVVIAEDSVLLRDGLARMLTDHGHEVVGATEDAVGLVQLVDAGSPDLVILDVRMPPTHTDEGIRAAIELRARRPELRIARPLAVRRGELRERAARRRPRRRSPTSSRTA